MERAPLEAQLVARAVLDDTLLDAVPVEHLSPAANLLLDLITEYPAATRLDLVGVARVFGDDYAARLALRADGLTARELFALSRDALVTLCRQLPAVSARRKVA